MNAASSFDPGQADLCDPVPLAQALIRCASVTPADDGAQAVLAATLQRLGFTVTPLPFNGTPNLFARRGAYGPHLCFAGHTDVVPAGDAAWTAPPFAAEIQDGVLLGRGACDMKGGIAAFVAAVAKVLETGPPSQTTPETAEADDDQRGSALAGSLSFLITGDEEGPATDGTVRVLDWMRANGHVPDFCLLGEPTNPHRLGEVVKIGRRGSLNARIAVHGTQGHVAYPARADNPVHRLLAILAGLTAAPLDEGCDGFEPSSVQITTVDVGNPSTNVIPAVARAGLNIRFNPLHTGDSLTQWLRAECSRHADRFDLAVTVSGEAFLTEAGPHVAALRQAVQQVTGIMPRLDTGGGTSDARFITQLCPVAEFGLVGATMHMADEGVPVRELRDLARIYAAVIRAMLASA